jgi:hypothetical protein
MTNKTLTRMKLIRDLCRDQFAMAGRGPIRVSLPFKLGQARDPEQIQITDQDGMRQKCQSKVLSRWPDGSIRWCLVEFVDDTSSTYYAELVDAALSPSRDSNLDSSALHSVTMIEFAVADSGEIANRIELRNVSISQSAFMQIHLRHDGLAFCGIPETPVSLESGPIRWSMQWSVRFETVELQPSDRTGQRSPLVGLLIASSYSDSSSVSFEFVVRNPQPMDHPGGNWDLGASGSVVIDELAVQFSLPDCSRNKRLSVDLLDTDQAIHASESLRVFQASSGGENWNSSNHMDCHGRVLLAFRGYKVDADGVEHSGLRAKPIVRFADEQVECSIGYQDFWQNFPKTISADSSGLKIGLFPAEVTGGTELQGGEQKTHQFAFEMQPANIPSHISACLNPPLTRVEPGVYADAEVLPYLTPKSERSDARYESLVNQAIDGQDTFDQKSEKIDEYGWRNFGDLYGDHEAVFHRGDEPMISHYNNQYDCTLGFAIQFLRSGDRRWFELMTQMADHAWDIDTYHTEDDKLLYNHGLFWHTYHYADAHTSTHRSYPKQLRVSQSFEGGQDLSELGETGEKLAKNYAIGGGPAAAHNYSTGWMVAYWLTGSERYRTAAISAADYVMRIEDGSQTPFRWLSRGDTGYSTCSSEGYYGPGRAAANSTLALLTGHELTGDVKYLRRAALLMRRTVHPNEDLDALDLLNAELRWFYTMYLQALGRFIDYKESNGERDDDFNYAVAALLHYANWMVEHERPTLSQPEHLQYPTETWAAQDIRKWHILQHAAQYEPRTHLRAAMKEKATFFFDYVCDTLGEFKTKSLCRPVVLMLNFGWQRDGLLVNQIHPKLSNVPNGNWGSPGVFRAQRPVALRRFKLLLVAAVTSFFFVLAAISWWAIVRWM